MEFEREINQTKPFKTEQIKAMLNVLYTAAGIQEKSISMLKKYGINDQHYNILRILKGQNGKPITPKKVKAVLINGRGDLTRLVDKLVKMELVDRAYDSKDRRSVQMVITVVGLDLLRRAEDDFSKEKVYEFDLTTNEAVQLNKLLDKLRG